MAGLPTKDAFIQNHIVLATCEICGEIFDKDHTPVQVCACRHLFGHNCVVAWFETHRNANTCPACRTVLFQVEQGPPLDARNNPSDNAPYDPIPDDLHLEGFSGGNDDWSLNPDLDFDEDADDEEEFIASVTQDNYNLEHNIGDFLATLANVRDNLGVDVQEAEAGAQEDESQNMSGNVLDDETMAWLVEDDGFQASNRLRDRDTSGEASDATRDATNDRPTGGSDAASSFYGLS